MIFLAFKKGTFLFMKGERTLYIYVYRIIIIINSPPAQKYTKFIPVLYQDITISHWLMEKYCHCLLWHGRDQLWYEEGGWTRVAYLNMTEPGTICPSGLTQKGYININHDVCGRPTSSSAGLWLNLLLHLWSKLKYVEKREDTSTNHLTVSLNFKDLLVLTLTMFSVFQKHTVVILVNTYGHSYAGLTETRLDSVGCPCNNGNAASSPSFVGNDYYCE